MATKSDIIKSLETNNAILQGQIDRAKKGKGIFFGDPEKSIKAWARKIKSNNNKINKLK